MEEHSQPQKLPRPSGPPRLRRKHSMLMKIVVPPGVKPGQQLLIQTATPKGRKFKVTVPENARAGHRLELRVPAHLVEPRPSPAPAAPTPAPRVADLRSKPMTLETRLRKFYAFHNITKDDASIQKLVTMFAKPSHHAALFKQLDGKYGRGPEECYPSSKPNLPPPSPSVAIMSGGSIRNLDRRASPQTLRVPPRPASSSAKPPPPPAQEDATLDAGRVEIAARPVDEVVEELRYVHDKIRMTHDMQKQEWVDMRASVEMRIAAKRQFVKVLEKENDAALKAARKADKAVKQAASDATAMAVQEQAKTMWSHVEKLRVELDQARLSYEDDKTRFLLPKHDGYRFVTGGDGIYIGFAAIYFERLQGRVSIELEPPASVSGLAHARVEAAEGAAAGTAARGGGGGGGGETHNASSLSSSLSRPRLSIVLSNPAKGMLPGARQARRSGVVIALRLTGVRLISETTGIPSTRFSSLTIEAEVDCHIPLEFVSADEADVRSGEGKVDDAGTWRATKDYTLKLVKLHRIRGTKLPRNMVHTLVNYCLNVSSFKATIIEAIPPELGASLLALPVKDAHCLELEAVIAASGTDTDVLDADLGAFGPRAAVALAHLGINEDQRRVLAAAVAAVLARDGMGLGKAARIKPRTDRPLKAARSRSPPLGSSSNSGGGGGPGHVAEDEEETEEGRAALEKDNRGRRTVFGDAQCERWKGSGITLLLLCDYVRRVGRTALWPHLVGLWQELLCAVAATEPILPSRLPGGAEVRFKPFGGTKGDACAALMQRVHDTQRNRISIHIEVGHLRLHVHANDALVMAAEIGKRWVRMARVRDSKGRVLGSPAAGEKSMKRVDAPAQLARLSSTQEARATPPTPPPRDTSDTLALETGMEASFSTWLSREQAKLRGLGAVLQKLALVVLVAVDGGDEGVLQLSGRRMAVLLPFCEFQGYIPRLSVSCKATMLVDNLIGRVHGWIRETKTALVAAKAAEQAKAKAGKAGEGDDEDEDEDHTVSTLEENLHYYYELLSSMDTSRKYLNEKNLSCGCRLRASLEYRNGGVLHLDCDSRADLPSEASLEASFSRRSLAEESSHSQGDHATGAQQAAAAGAADDGSGGSAHEENLEGSGSDQSESGLSSCGDQSDTELSPAADEQDEADGGSGSSNPPPPTPPARGSSMQPEKKKKKKKKRLRLEKKMKRFVRAATGVTVGSSSTADTAALSKHKLRVPNLLQEHQSPSSRILGWSAIAGNKNKSAAATMLLETFEDVGDEGEDELEHDIQERMLSHSGGARLRRRAGEGKTKAKKWLPALVLDTSVQLLELLEDLGFLDPDVHDSELQLRRRTPLNVLFGEDTSSTSATKNGGKGDNNNNNDHHASSSSTSVEKAAAEEASVGPD